MNHPRTVALVMLAGLIVIPAGQSSAQVRYVDEQGNPHWVQAEDHVPMQYRGKAARSNLPDLLNGNVIRDDQVRPEAEGKRKATSDTEWMATSFSEIEKRAQEQARIDVEWRMQQKAEQRAAEEQRNRVGQYQIMGEPAQQAGPAVSQRRRPTDPMTFEEALGEWERQRAIEKQAAAERRLFNRCNSVRSDQATPALLAQCLKLGK